MLFRSPPFYTLIRLGALKFQERITRTLTPSVHNIKYPPYRRPATHVARGE
jgi:hypothetical protein